MTESNIEKILDTVTADDLPPPLSDFAKVIGIRNLYKISDSIGESDIRIPKVGALYLKLVKPLIIREYETTAITMEKLADKYELSLKTIFNYTRGVKKKV
jgi:hypothetical protein